MTPRSYILHRPKNSRCIRTIIQQKILSVAADLDLNYFERCLEKYSYFSLIVDEPTTQGWSILSLCLWLLDFIFDQSRPTKVGFFLKLCGTERLTREAREKSLLLSLWEIGKCRSVTAMVKHTIIRDRWILTKWVHKLTLANSNLTRIIKAVAYIRWSRLSIVLGR